MTNEELAEKVAESVRGMRRFSSEDDIPLFEESLEMSPGFAAYGDANGDVKATVPLFHSRWDKVADTLVIAIPCFSSFSD